uniref:Limonene synthase n=3 Tax=Mentha TaxID=21819 RepID=R9W0V6_9LAMI|nr:limonene synthase [Mentha canadensis]AGN90906.1 limonene synthase [Mentha canadensis]AGN90907.1 limonene synthase [Mentha canadensis]AGN90910.1 limonene synthase [Mentha suaveolens]AGN90912.1 limonene synthase [Mentha spicata]
MALKVFSVATQMAIPSKLTTCLQPSHLKSSPKLFPSTNSSGRSRLRVYCSSSQLTTERRSGNYNPSRWDVEFIQSLHSDYKKDKHAIRASELVTLVKMELEKETDQIRQLELIDDLQRMGLSDHFQNEFKEILSSIYLDHHYYKNPFPKEERDLYSTSLAFRLLREHGFQVAQEVFDSFKNEEGEFKESLSDDTRGLLQLYEASFLLTEGETTLESAREFATKFLEERVNEGGGDGDLLTRIAYSLDIPLHWRIKRPNAPVWIEWYRKRPDMNPAVLELAILDLNIVQAQFQEELKESFRWWRNTGFVEKLPFARDRLVECYFWNTGIIEPRQHASARIMMGKVNALITVIDDIYDVYGTLEELEQFTDLIRRWDINSIDQLPDYMQLCFLALNNFVDDTSYDVMKEKGVNVIPYLRQSWVDLADKYMVEARWFYGGHKPSLEEYLENSWQSISGPCMLTHIFFRVTDSFTKETVDSLYKYHDLVRWSSFVLRLADDLGTSVEEVSRGDVPKSLQCYMSDYNASEAEARKHVKWLIAEVWKKMNAERVSKDSPFGKDFIGCAVDLGRMAQLMYHNGDGHGTQHPIIHQQMTRTLFEPFA